MILADCHVHSAFSDDCETPVEQMIETAIAQGKKYFYLTDHQDFDYPVMDDGVTFQLAQEPYVRRMEELKYQYKDKIDIRIGVELGLMAHIKDKTEAYAKAYDYDFIIGSSHMVNGVDPYYPAYYADKNEYQSYEQYFLSYFIVGSMIPSIPYSKVAGLRILFGHAAIHAWQAVQAFLNASIFPAPGGRIGAFPFSNVCFAGIIISNSSQLLGSFSNSSILP